jgi:hypothetical protein
MKVKIHNLIWAIIILLLPNQHLAAQESTAHMSIFNAVESENNLLIDWGTVDAFPSGIPSGQSFGAVIVPAGKVAITAKVEGFVNGKSPESVPASTTCAYIVWPGQFEDKDPEPGEPRKRKLEITALTPIPLATSSSTPNWTLIYTGLLKEVVVNFNGRLQLLKRGKETSPLRSIAAVVTQGEKILESRSMESGNYAIVIYGDDPQNLKAGIIYR